MTRHCRSLAAALLCATVASGAKASWEYTSWGMTPAQVVAASHGTVHLIPPEHRLGPSRPDVTTRAEGTFTDGKLQLSVSFSFADHGGLVLVTYLTRDAAQNTLLRSRLVHAYGTPTPGGDADMGSGVWHHAGQDVIDLSISDESPAFVVQYPQAAALSATSPPKPDAGHR